MMPLSFEERVALLVDREVHARNDRKLARLINNAHLRYGQSALEEIEARVRRSVDRREVMSFAWVSAPVVFWSPAHRRRQMVAGLRTGAVRMPAWPFVIYLCVARLQEKLRIRHGIGAFGKWLPHLVKTDVLILDGPVSGPSTM